LNKIKLGLENHSGKAVEGRSRHITVRQESCCERGVMVGRFGGIKKRGPRMATQEGIKNHNRVILEWECGEKNIRNGGGEVVGNFKTLGGGGECTD